MPLEQQFTCPLPNGVHARPASALEEVVRAFDSDVILVNQRTLRSANSKSILAIVGADIRHTDECLFKISGPDEKEAMAALTVFLKDKFPLCDQPLSTALKRDGDKALPHCLSSAGSVVHRGLPVAPGIGMGRIVHVGKYTLPCPLPRNGTHSSETEWRRLGRALDNLVDRCNERLASATSAVERELLGVHRSIARDVEFRQRLEEEVIGRRRSAAEAIASVENHFSQALAATGSELLCDRALDIQDVCTDLLRELYGEAVGETKTRLTGDSIVVADSLTPGQFLALDREFLKGLVLAHASATSHTVILARSFNIPALAGLEGMANLNSTGQEAIVDADSGVLLTRLTDTARRYYSLERQRILGRQARLKRLAAKPGATRDGHRVEVVANIATAGEASVALDAGAEGVGLFRTEMLFLDRESAPGENDQFTVYRDLVQAANGRPVVIRTLDIGGDKKLSYLKLPAEENPFLGCRAVRIYPAFEPLFRTQVRALVRASAFGNLRLMIPMIATLDEAQWVKRVIADEQKKCAAGNIKFDAAMPVGAMIEVPSAVFEMVALCREFDFFSIGSNDLLQYFMAVDRMNPRLAALYDPLQPSFLRLIKQAADTARARQKSISLCGEMGAQPRFAPLLIGLGVDKISAAAPAIAGIKAELAACDFVECRELATETLQCHSAAEVAARLKQFSLRHNPPLFEPDLIIVDSDATTKEEAIKQATDLLFVLGRTDDARAVEEAIWQREASYSTGFGHGFAIPHCKNAGVGYNSLVLQKLRRPVPWNSIDGEPVRVVVLLAIRDDQENSTHMKVLAKLARKIVDDSFRSRIESENNADKLCAILQQSFEE